MPDITSVTAAAELIAAAPSTMQEWARRPGELIPAAYVVARAWLACGVAARVADLAPTSGELVRYRVTASGGLSALAGVEFHVDAAATEDDVAAAAADAVAEWLSYGWELADGPQPAGVEARSVV